MSQDKDRFFLFVGVFLGVLALGPVAEVYAVASPNGQYGQCGPYYLWYQIGPEALTYTGDYVDLCEIIFDIQDVVDDFDFVYFTDTETIRRAALDQNHDGISDLYYAPLRNVQQLSEEQNQDRKKLIEQPRDEATPPPNPNLLRWQPAHGCVRVNLRECWQSTFNERCGYAMISIQPKPGYRTGRAEIPVTIKKRCPPNGVSCNETATIVHTYSECYTPSQPDFIVNKSVDKMIGDGYSTTEFNFTITVYNVGDKKGSVDLIDTFTDGTYGEQLTLSELRIVDCPQTSSCQIKSITERQIQIALTSLNVNTAIKITYKLMGNNQAISENDVSYFTNIARLSNGSMSQIMFGLKGSGKFPRKENPKPPQPPPGR